MLDSVTPERVQQLAVNKLRAIPLQVYVAGEQVLGRLRIEPEQFKACNGTVLERHHAFAVRGHDRLAFLEPSPLGRLPEIRFSDVVDKAELVARVAEAWTGVVDAIEHTLRRIQRLIPGATLVQDVWAVEAACFEMGAVVSVRADPDTGMAWIDAVDGLPTEGSQHAGPVLIDLDATPEAFRHQLQAVIESVRARTHRPWRPLPC